MIVKAIRYEWLQDYKLPSMYIAFPNCSFKCEKECGKKMCQNGYLATLTSMDVNIDDVINYYLSNPITKSIVCGGLEPIDSFKDLFFFIWKLRRVYNCKDDVVIYTGYNKDEIPEEIWCLKNFENIVIKFGRYIPNQTPYFDEILGVRLASNNQYAERIS